MLAKRWDVPARHVDMLYAYVKADKAKQVDIYLRIPQGIFITQEDVWKLGVTRKADMALQLKKSLYGLNQAGGLWIQLLHTKMEKNGFDRCATVMCLYYKRVVGKMAIVAVYVGDLLVTLSTARLLKEFFSTMGMLSIKDLGDVRNFCAR
uniref:PREDICTED: GagproteaseintegraseRTRNaseH polyproteinlike putative n=1 Tax=Albugo laibachii Nc14 TaxID=890382 RepID=F0WZI4_9STRA|nr:PREDICTED: GagproteaseintegraseRTRNaseH polyproteinlike putative [Albugo laibachii Nc14]|eukprot:CCA26908.1 PREDICTED: GagproteaseintegraseRTRNaseH polyproteinlike putative [Albugo laibachii Nc14]